MTATHPLRRLRVFAAPYRARIRRGVAFSVLNKFFDVLPEILIGVAVDVVVNQRDVGGLRANTYVRVVNGKVVLR